MSESTKHAGPMGTLVIGLVSACAADRLPRLDHARACRPVGRAVDCGTVPTVMFLSSSSGWFHDTRHYIRCTPFRYPHGVLGCRGFRSLVSSAQGAPGNDPHDWDPDDWWKRLRWSQPRLSPKFLLPPHQRSIEEVLDESFAEYKQRRQVPPVPRRVVRVSHADTLLYAQMIQRVEQSLATSRMLHPMLWIRPLALVVSRGHPQGFSDPFAPTHGMAHESDESYLFYNEGGQLADLLIPEVLCDDKVPRETILALELYEVTHTGWSIREELPLDSIERRAFDRWLAGIQSQCRRLADQQGS